jgi:methionine-gamma-lyase
MTHSTYTEEELAKYDITPTLIRIAIGLENIDELIADFDQALEIAAKSPK